MSDNNNASTNLQQAQPTAQPTAGVQPMAAQHGAVAKSPKDMLRDVLSEQSVMDSIKKACGKHQDTFVATLMEVYVQDGKLKQCDPRYVVAEGLKSVTLGLPLNRQLGFAYILPFNEAVKDQNGNKVYERDANGQVKRYSNGVPIVQRRMTPRLVIGYRGYIQMALRTGQYLHINTDVVCEGQLLSNNFLTGVFDFNGQKESDHPIGYFAYIELKSGFSKTLYMTLDEMCEYAILYGNGIPSSENAASLKKKALEQVVTGPKGLGWVGDFESMALKTVIRRVLMNYGIITPEMTAAFASDQDYNYNGMEDQPNDSGRTVINLDPSSYKVEPAEQQPAPANGAPQSAPQPGQQPPANQPPIDDGPGY